MDLAASTHRDTSNVPEAEIFGLQYQLRRSGAPAPANIAEGNGRETSGQYNQYLRIAKGAIKGLETHGLSCQRIGLPEGDASERLMAAYTSAGAVLPDLMRSLP